jgi:cytidine deaminase
LPDFDATRLSVSLMDVVAGREQEFLALAREFAALLDAKAYGRFEIVRDESDPRRYYAVRRWNSAESAEACHGDHDVQALSTLLYQVARVVHIVNGVRRAEALRLLLDDRRTVFEADRRSGFDRRMADTGRAEGERRSGRDRRIGPQRVRERTEPIDLLAAARRARENADAAFSRFRVGAALQTVDGSVVTGCNVETASFGLTICAERLALYKAISDGHRAFSRIAIVADAPGPTPPCGACRQALWEFGGNLEIVLGNLAEAIATYRLQDLMPLPFDARLLPPRQT